MRPGVPKHGRTPNGQDVEPGAARGHADRREARDALLLQAVLAFRAGRMEEAEALAERTRRLEPRFFPALQLLGMIASRTGRRSVAIKWLREAAAGDPTSADIRLELAGVLHADGRAAEAIPILRQALQLKPDDARVHDSLGLACLAAGRVPDALASFEAAAAAQPDVAAFRCHLASALEQVGRDEAAIHAYRWALRLAPDLVEALVGLGRVLQQVGDFDLASPCFERAIALEPRQAAPYLRLVSGRKVSAADRPLLERMTGLLHEGGLTEQDALNLHYALGKALDDLADYERAMHHFDEANSIAVRRLRLSGRAFDRRQHAVNVDRIIATFRADFFTRHSTLGSSSERPVFILGMIRSGTTLVEQILSSHPRIGAGGELRFWGEKAPLLSQVAAGRFSRTAARRLADDYEALLRDLAPDASLVTDKMPTNFLLIGLIRLIFPRARIIHCRRNAVDTCLSIYVTPYADMTDFAHDRGNIVAYYRQYERLMTHWRQLLSPDRFLEIEYERLVAERETVTRQMVAFCGVEWDDRCLRHEHNPRLIRTPSKWQARQPIYTGSVARWRHYEPWLREFRELLTPAES
jgi:tetratricopeptide (TPR) repeat protein